MKNILRVLYSGLLSLFIYTGSLAQSYYVQINGASSACSGQSQPFSATFIDPNHSSAYTPNWYSWSVTGGTFVGGGTSMDGNFTTVSVNWSGTNGTITVGALYKETPTSIHFIDNDSKGVSILSGAAQATVLPPSVICDTQVGSVTFNAGITNKAGTITYHWFKNNVDLGATGSEQLTTSVAAGTTIRFTATSTGFCSGPSTINSDTYTVSILPSTPDFPVTASKTNVCSGEAITFSVSSPFINGNTSYNWQYKGQTRSVMSTFTISVHTDPAIPAYHEGEAVVVSLGGLSGACLSSPNYTTELQVNSIDVLPVPSLPVLDQGGTCSGTSMSFTGTPGVNAQAIRWYDQANGGAPLATANTYSITDLNRVDPIYATSYNTQNFCESSRMEVITLPSVTAQNQTICPGPLTLAITSNGITGTTYAWTANASPGIGGAANGSGSAITATLSNTTASVGTVTYTIVPMAKGCSGAPKDVLVTLKQEPAIAADNQQIFTGQTTNIPIATSNNVPGTAFTWTAVGADVSGETNGGGNLIAQLLTNNTAEDQTVQYTISAIANGCAATQPKIVVATVSPFPAGPAYVNLHKVQVPNITDPSLVNIQPVNIVNHTAVYYDGLDRKMQTVILQGSPNHEDVVQLQAYDEAGRESRKYLPFVMGSDGLYKENVIDPVTKEFTGVAKSFYTVGGEVANDPKPYAETAFEPSPLNRPLKQGAPGESWQPNNDPYSLNDKTVKKRFDLNTANDQILKFIYDPVTDQLSGGDATGFIFYDADELQANRTLDENNNEVIEYVDRLGRTICKKVQYGVDGTTKLYASTYYIYDYKDKLILVLPPEAIVEILKQQP